MGVGVVEVLMVFSASRFFLRRIRDFILYGGWSGGGIDGVLKVLIGGMGGGILKVLIGGGGGGDLDGIL